MTELGLSQVKKAVRSRTSRLAATYLSIIMLMSIGFSFVFYNTSVHQLDRQRPPASFYTTYLGDVALQIPVSPGSNFDTYLKSRIAEGRHELLLQLVGVNVAVLLLGAVISLYLARRTLEPIEASMEAQSRFVSDASHELRTPLTALQTTNEVALRKSKLSQTEIKELLAHNVEEAVKLKTLSDSLLDLLQQGRMAAKFSAVQLQEIAGDAMNQIVDVASNKSIAVQDSVPNISVQGDRSLLARVITILLDNAVKYSPSGSTIYLQGSSKGKYGYISVRDEGPGIDEADAPHIFERFYRADQARLRKGQGGYGLGLAIANAIVAQHDGTISFDSKLGAGTTFTVRLPLAKVSG